MSTTQERRNIQKSLTTLAAGRRPPYPLHCVKETRICTLYTNHNLYTFSFKNAREKKAKATDMSDTTTAVEATDFQEIESEYGTGEDKAAVGLQLSFNH